MFGMSGRAVVASRLAPPCQLLVAVSHQRGLASAVNSGRFVWSTSEAALHQVSVLNFAFELDRR
jgi:hypothetical protein